MMMAVDLTTGEASRLSALQLSACAEKLYGDEFRMGSTHSQAVSAEHYPMTLT